MRIGVDYYPEHWDKALWTSDADLMQKIGVKLVRMAEFAWSRLEPTDNNFDFSWLDEAIEIFASRDIKVVLGTPTNCPPRWLCESHPEIMPVGENGKTNPIGIRGHRCYNSPVLREYSERIIRKMAERYKDNSAVVAWQIDNELEANICYCEVCNEKHRAWLKAKYGTLEALNQAYGNAVWSGDYSSWEQIDPPYGGYNTAWLNPSYMLDFRRRTAEDVTEFAKFQANIIRSIIPDAIITTNTWFCYNMPDFYELYKNLDFVSYDNYPTTNIPTDSESIYTNAIGLDLMRGIKRENFWIMEQLSGGQGCWMPMRKTTRPGMIKGYALQAFAHGADTVVHFRWRTAAIGAEMHCHGLLDHDNLPNRRLEEFSELCNCAKALTEFQGTQIKSDIAILYSVESEYAFKLQPQTDGYNYMEQINLLHEAFGRFGLNVDIVDEHADISNYKVVCAPELYIVNEETVQKLYAFTEQGGKVVLTARSGEKDKNNNCIMAPLPTVYSKLVGCTVSEYDPIGYDTVKVKFKDGETFTCKQWCDVLKTDTATPVAFYDGNFYKGNPAITVNSYGKGKAYYIGTIGERKLYEKLALEIIDGIGISHTERLPENVEITTRSGNGKQAVFVFNNADKEQELSLFNSTLNLKPFEMKIICK